MQIGVIGRGRLGGNIMPHCVVFDVNVKPREALAKEGAAGAGAGPIFCGSRRRT